MKIVVLLILALSIATCKTSSRSKPRATITQPINYFDDGCATLETLAALDGPACPGEQKALEYYFNFQSSNIKELDEEYDYRVKFFLISVGEIKQQREQSLLSGSDIEALDNRTAKVIESFATWHKNFASTTLYLQNLDVRVPTVPSEGLVEKMPVIDQLKFLGCVVPSGLEVSIDSNYAGAMCELSFTADKFRDMIATRDAVVATIGRERAAAFNSGFRTSLEAARNEMLSFQETFISKVKNHQEMIETKNFGALNAKTVSYPALVMQPTELLNQAKVALNRLKDSANTFSQLEKDMFIGEQTETQLSVAIEQQSKETAENQSQIKQAELEEKRLLAEINAKKAEQVRVEAETGKSRARLVTDLSALKNPSTPNDIVNELNPRIEAKSIQSISSTQIPLSKPSSETETQVLVYNFEKVPPLVVNGVYYRASRYVENATNYLKGKEHNAYRSRWYGKSKKEPTTSNNAGTPDILARDYTNTQDRVVAAVARNIRETMSNAEITVWGRYTNGLDGYIVSASTGTSASRNKNNPWDGVATSGLTTGLTTAGGMVGGVIGSVVPGAGTVAGTVIGSAVGNMIGGAIEAGRKKAYSDSKSTSTGVSYSTGYYHILAKYPDIRLGQLVGELGCEVNGTTVYNRKTEVDISPEGIAAADPEKPSDVALPKLIAPIENDDPARYRFPAGNQGALLVNIPAACSAPKLRFVINDYPTGFASSNDCLTGEAPTSSAPQGGLAGVVSQRSKAVCSYMEEDLLGRVSQVVSLDSEIQKSLNLIQQYQLNEPSNPIPELRDLAYGSDPYEEIQAFYRQKGNQAGISAAAIELTLPIVRNFATGLLNDRRLAELGVQIADLDAKRDMIVQQRNDLDNKLKMIGDVSNLYQGSMNRNKVYNGLIANRAKLAFSVSISHLDSLNFWTDTLFESLSYNEYRRSDSSSSISVENDQKQVRAAIREIYKVILRGETEQKVAALIGIQIAKIEKILNFNENIIVLNTQLFLQDIGHCQVSLYHLYSNAFPVVTPTSSNPEAAPYTNAQGGPGRKDELLVLDDRYGIKKNYGFGEQGYYYVPFDMNALYEIYDGTFTKQQAVPPSADISARQQSFKRGIQCTFPADSMRSNKIPRLLGIAVEFLGVQASIVNLPTNNLIRLDRSNVMSWYNPQKKVFFRVIDYSSLQTNSLLKDMPFIKSLPEVSAYYNGQGQNNPCSAGATQTACIQRRLGDIGNTSDLAVRGFPFRLLEYNLLLGNKWALVIDNDVTKEAFRDASNVLIHVYWYKSRPVVSIR